MRSKGKWICTFKHILFLRVHDNVQTFFFFYYFEEISQHFLLPYEKSRNPCTFEGNDSFLYVETTTDKQYYRGINNAVR